MMKRLENKVAIVTGGSRGIGFATVQAFLREGATVILTASSQESADRAVTKLKEEFPFLNSNQEPELHCYINESTPSILSFFAASRTASLSIMLTLQYSSEYLWAILSGR